mgnify:CR=1 FL=1
MYSSISSETTETSIESFEEHNTHLNYRYFAGVKKHLTQDYIFDRFIREKIDCSRMYEDKFVFEGQEYDGKGVRGLIADIENQGLYILAYMAEKTYGKKTNQAWFDKHVKARLDEEYTEDLAAGTYNYMKIPAVINERITNGDWSHLDDGPIPYEEYLKTPDELLKKIACSEKSKEETERLVAFAMRAIEEFKDKDKLITEEKRKDQLIKWASFFRRNWNLYAAHRLKIHLPSPDKPIIPNISFCSIFKDIEIYENI